MIAAIPSLIARGILWQRLALPLAILAGLLTVGSTVSPFCTDPRSVEALRLGGAPRLAPQWLPDAEHIVFDEYNPEGGRRNSADIYIVRSDGSGLKRISASSGDYEIDSWPDLSPDGTRVVYATSRHRGSPKRNFEIETYALDGSDRRRLTKNGVHDLSPVWSPDGSRIAFRNLADGDEIVVMAADGSDKRNFLASRTLDPGDFDLEQGAVVAGGSVIAGPAWSPDGETISFVGSAYIEKPKDRGKLSVLYTVGADGEGLTPLFVTDYEENLIASEFSWSPDGRELAFMHYDRATEEWGLYAIGRDGTGLRKLAEVHRRSSSTSHLSVSGLSWSPKGDEILFALLIGAPTNVFAAKADGSGFRGEELGEIGSWSPDGSRIAIRNLPSSAANLGTIAPDGSDVRELVLRYTDGSLRAANPEDRTCLLWFCW